MAAARRTTLTLLVEFCSEHSTPSYEEIRSKQRANDAFLLTGFIKMQFLNAMVFILLFMAFIFDISKLNDIGAKNLFGWILVMALFREDNLYDFFLLWEDCDGFLAGWLRHATFIFLTKGKLGSNSFKCWWAWGKADIKIILERDADIYKKLHTIKEKVLQHLGAITLAVSFWNQSGNVDVWFPNHMSTNPEDKQAMKAITPRQSLRTRSIFRGKSTHRFKRGYKMSLFEAVHLYNNFQQHVLFAYLLELSGIAGRSKVLTDLLEGLQDPGLAVELRLKIGSEPSRS
ncbi:hypothetical protein NC651_019120 [Populus alba x Populus x berolinensis]|nr:hypothetical protein NC651_019120 [Populus alba x Populus x berolinensis]